MNKRIRKLAAFVSAGLLAVSCGDMGGPVSSVPQQAEPILAVPNPEGRDFIVFGEAALIRAKRALSATSLTASVEEEVKYNKKAKLKVKFDKYDSDFRVQEAEFEIKKKSIGNADPIWKNYYRIGMTVESGQSLSDVKVKFSPSGMTFDPVAKLTLKVKGDLDPDEITAYHVSSRGKVSKPKFKAKKEKSDRWKLEVEVPSFSTYSYDDDDRYSDEEEPDMY